MPPTVRDRTQEFFATVDSFQQLGHTSSPSRSKTAIPSTAILSKSSIEQSSRIRNLANQIAENIDDVSQKIIQLEQLAKLTSNFRDERPKIQSLMLTIKQDIDRLNMDLKTLQTFLSQSFNEISSQHNCIEHHKSLLKVLQGRYSNLAKSFGSACEISTKHLQRQKKQREKFGFGPNKKKSFRKVPMNRLQKSMSMCKDKIISITISDYIYYDLFDILSHDVLYNKGLLQITTMNIRMRSFQTEEQPNLVRAECILPFNAIA